MESVDRVKGFNTSALLGLNTGLARAVSDVDLMVFCEL